MALNTRKQLEYLEPLFSYYTLLQMSRLRQVIHRLEEGFLIGAGDQGQRPASWILERPTSSPSRGFNFRRFLGLGNQVGIQT